MTFTNYRKPPAIGSNEITDGSILNADVNASAAIAVSKLAATTASKALVSDASGFIAASATTATELGYVAGVTSAIQTQINALSTPTTTTITTRDGSAAPGAGTLGEFKSAVGGAATNTSTETDIVTLTLTAGVWLFTAWSQSDPGGGQTGFDMSVSVKGVFTSTYGIDYGSARYAASDKDQIALPPQIVAVATGDSDKTIKIQSLSTTASGWTSGYITAVRVA